MLRLFRYLKGSAHIIAVIVVLLAVQAMCELALPDYTSRIVDVGIQQGGVETPVPEVVRKSTMDKLLLVMRSGEKDIVLAYYRLIEKDGVDAGERDALLKKYPALANEALYMLKENTDEASRKALEAIFTRAGMLVAGIDSGLEQAAFFAERLGEALPQGAAPAGATVYELLAMMPDGAREGVFDALDGQMAELPERMAKQIASGLIKREYEAIGMDTGAMLSRYILFAGVKMLALALLAAAATISVTFFSARIAAGLGRDLRRGVFSRVVSFSHEEMDRFSTASLITRSTNDVQQIQMMLAMLFRIVVYAPILGAGGFFKAVRTNSSMSWVIGIAVLTILSIVTVVFSVAMPRFKRLQTLIDRLNLVSREILSGLAVIRAFGNEKHEERRFDEANKNLMRTQLFVSRVMSAMMPVMMFVMNSIAVLIVWVGAGYVDSGKMQVGSMMAFIQYTMQIVMAFLMLSSISILLPRASVSAKRIVEVLDTEPAISDPENPEVFDSPSGGLLEFKDASFRYPGAKEYAISHVSFVARPGQTTAIIGSTGSGKSTLVNLIPRFYDVTEGAVYLDGKDIRSVTRRDLRERIGFVPQKAVLFSGTIGSNLRYGRQEASDDEIASAAETAQAMDFIREKEGGFDSPISQGGTNVSGGQKQRLSIARAIVKRPALYVFDDSFSALDYKTDAALRKALAEKTGDSTVIVVAQRISTVLGADQILVLDKGRVAGIGTHSSLMRDCEVYRQIALSQLSKEELA